MDRLNRKQVETRLMLNGGFNIVKDRRPKYKYLKSHDVSLKVLQGKFFKKLSIT